MIFKKIKERKTLDKIMKIIKEDPACAKKLSPNIYSCTEYVRQNYADRKNFTPMIKEVEKAMIRNRLI